MRGGGQGRQPQAVNGRALQVGILCDKMGKMTGKMTGLLRRSKRFITAEEGAVGV